MMEHPKAVEIIPFGGPHNLATVSRTDTRGGNHNVVVTANQEFHARRRHGCTHCLPLPLAAKEVVRTWPESALPAAIRKLASVALEPRRRNELSLIRTRMIRSGKATQRFISRSVKPDGAPREHYAFKS